MSLSKDTIYKIREEILKGKSKFQVSKEFGVCPETVYRYTKDLPNKIKRPPFICGKHLELLKQLLQDGFVYTGKNGNRLRSLQKFFPEIKRSQYKNKSIYYLEDKNKLALMEMMKHNKSRIVSFQDLSKISKVFGTNLDIKQKRGFLGKNLKPKRYKIKNFRKQHESFSKEKQSKIDDFFGRFLHSDVLRGSCSEGPYQET